uniref:Uncharacterized protein n=1 Tax=Theileria annulata TaxID=5874 RepID=A0A3B0NHL4_THEAN
MAYMYPINKIQIVSCILLFYSCMCNDQILELTSRNNPNVVIGHGSDHIGNYTAFVPWGHANVHTVTHNGIKIWKDDGSTPLLFVRFYELDYPRIVIHCGKRGSEVYLHYELRSGCWKYLEQPTLGDDIVQLHGDTGATVDTTVTSGISTTSTTGTTKDIDMDDLHIERLVIGSDTDESDDEIYEDMSGVGNKETLQTTLETTGESTQHDFSQHDDSQVDPAQEDSTQDDHTQVDPLYKNTEFQGVLLENPTYEGPSYENIPLDTEEGEYQELEYKDTAVYAQLRNRTENHGQRPESNYYDTISEHDYERVIGSDSEKQDENSDHESKTEDPIEFMTTDDELEEGASGYERTLGGLAGRGTSGDDQGGTPDGRPRLPPRNRPRTDLREGELTAEMLTQLEDDVFGDSNTSRSSSRDAVSGSSRSRSLLTSSTTSGSVSSTRSRTNSLRRSFKKYVYKPLSRIKSRLTSESSDYDDHIPSPTTPDDTVYHTTLPGTHEGDETHDTDMTHESSGYDTTSYEASANENKRDYENVEETGGTETGRRKKLKTHHKKDSGKPGKGSRISLKMFKKSIRKHKKKHKKTKDKKKKEKEPEDGPEVIQVELGSDDDDEHPLLGD